jgi:hypothetical protein
MSRRSGSRPTSSLRTFRPSNPPPPARSAPLAHHRSAGHGTTTQAVSYFSTSVQIPTIGFSTHPIRTAVNAAFTTCATKEHTLRHLSVVDLAEPRKNQAQHCCQNWTPHRHLPDLACASPTDTPHRLTGCGAGYEHYARRSYRLPKTVSSSNPTAETSSGKAGSKRSRRLCGSGSRPSIARNKSGTEPAAQACGLQEVG